MSVSVRIPTILRTFTGGQHEHGTQHWDRSQPAGERSRPGEEEGRGRYRQKSEGA